MAFLFDHGPSLGAEEFRLLRDLVNRFCGIYFERDVRFLVERRLRERLRELGLSSYFAYYEYLRGHPNGGAELERAIDALTTNETYFFRERYQLQAFRDEVLPELVARNANQKRLSIWSAGCSTGEEVYTLAMLLRSSGLVDGWEVRVFGSDIGRRVLTKAREAIYAEGAFRALPAEYAHEFVDVPGGRAVRPEVRALCHFGHINLLEHDRTAIVGKVDAVFCRNVLIYFDERSRRRVLRTFWERLVRGGYLLLGHSESLLQTTTDFELRHLNADLVYRRPVSSRSLIPAPDAGAEEL